MNKTDVLQCQNLYKIALNGILMGAAYLACFRAAIKLRPSWLRGGLVRKFRRLLDGKFLGVQVKEYKDITEFSFGKGWLKGQIVLIPKENGESVGEGLDLLSYFSQPNELICRGGIVYDGGAWPGEFSVVASRIVGENGKVYAFEPNPRHIETLEKTLELNRCGGSVEIVPRALSDKTREAARFLVDGAGSRVLNNGNGGSVEKEIIEVETVSIDDFASGKKLPNVIKLDVEGEELRAVGGALRTISKVHPTWAIASYHLTREGAQTWGHLEPELRRAGYTVVTAFPAHKTTFAYV